MTDLDSVLRPLGACQRRRDLGEVEAQLFRVIDLAFFRDAEQLLCFEVGFKGINLGFGAAGAMEVIDGGFVDWEEAHGSAVLGRHVGDSGAISE